MPTVSSSRPDHAKHVSVVGGPEGALLK